jgi:BMFP domain-containing protein YqiC
MIAGPWADRAEFEIWWQLNVRALNRLSVTDREEFERVCRVIEAFNAEHPK